MCTFAFDDPVTKGNEHRRVGSGDRQGEFRVGWEGRYSPPHHSCIYEPLRTPLALIILVLIRLVNDLFRDDFLIIEPSEEQWQKARHDKSVDQNDTSYLNDIYIPNRDKITYEAIMTQHVPSSVITPMAPPARPGVRLTSNKCARPV